MKQHLSPLELSALLEGNLLGPARRRAVRHLARCPECLADLLAVRRGLAAVGALPPPVYHHVLEEGLAWLQAVVPLPLWVLNAILLALFHLLLALACDLSALWFLRGTFFLFLDFLPVVWFASWLLVYWEDLRCLSRHLAAALPDQAEVERFVKRDLALVFGWWQLPLPGGRRLSVSPLVSTLLLVLADRVFFRLTQPSVGPKIWTIDVVFLYPIFVISAVFWTGVGSVWLFVHLARLLTKMGPSDRAAGLQEVTDRVLYRFVAVMGVGLTMWLMTTCVKQGWPHDYGELFSLTLVGLLGAYTFFRWRVFGAKWPFSPGWRPRWAAAVGAWLAAMGPGLGALAVCLL